MEESFPRILALHPGLDLGQLPEVWPASPHAEMDLQIIEEHKMNLGCRSVSYFLCNPG